MDSKGYCDVYKTFFDSFPLGFFIIERSGLIKSANEAGAKVVGVKTLDLVSKNFSRYVAPESQYTFSHYMTSLTKETVPKSCDIKMMRRFMPFFYARIFGMPVADSRGDNSDYLIVISETGHRKKIDEADSQGLEKEISSATSTEKVMLNNLNQPIAIIANYIYGCIHRIEGNQSFQGVLQAMRQAEHELHRLSEMIMRMRNFSCRNVFQYESIEIDEVIEEIVGILNHEIVAYPVRIEYKSSRGFPKMVLDKLYIQQAILNLARNAIDAMQGDNIREPRLVIEVNRQNKNTFEICLADNGPAFKLDKAHRLFEPDFTTKSYGVGLGLLMSRIIIETHGGKLVAGLNPTGGACFKIELPMVSLAH